MTPTPRRPNTVAHALVRCLQITSWPTALLALASGHDAPPAAAACKDESESVRGAKRRREPATGGARE